MTGPGGWWRQILTWALLLCIVGLLTFVGRQNLIEKRIRRKQEETIAVIHAVCGAIDLFNLEQHRLPVQLKDLVERPPYVEKSRWPSGGYLRQLPRDAWNRDLI